VNKEGRTSRALEYDLIVAMNAQTYARDIKEVRPGGYVLFDSTWPLDKGLLRPDVTFLGVPFAQLCIQHFRESRERILMKNIAYAGSLIALLDIELNVVEELLQETFSKKKALLESNYKALKLGYDFAKQNFECPLAFRVQRMNANGDKILIDGNTATALGALYAGCTVAAWYPITPATSVMESFKSLCERYRKDPQTGKNNFAILQAEDELAAIGMVIGAGWAGARAFTSTAGPGVSLMNEFLGLAYYAEIPAVLVDVQRVGPSTGMPTRTQQADLLLCAYASHGDTKHILLFPADPAECFEFAVKSFDLAEKFQTPVILMSDLDIGMNDWVVPRLNWSDSYRPERGRVLSPEQIEKLGHFHRYADEDEYFVTPRTLPGVSPKAAYLTRGSGHNRLGGYTELPEEYQAVVDRLAEKHRAAAPFIPPPIIELSRRPSGKGKRSASLSLVTLGGCDAAVREALDLLSEKGVIGDYMRIRGFPFGAEVETFLNTHDVNYIVEQNRDHQLKSLITLETSVPKEKLESLLFYGGFPLSAGQVVEGVLSAMGKTDAETARGLGGMPEALSGAEG
jgi:2-oxoglutarate ferredoxin oxidoreductase subunit alpha